MIRLLKMDRDGRLRRRQNPWTRPVLFIPFRPLAQWRVIPFRQLAQWRVIPFRQPAQ